MYTTPQKVRNILIGVGTDIMSDEQISEFIQDAENVINSYLSTKYSVPFSEVPPLVETMTKNLSAYLIMRTLYSQEGKNENEWVESFKKFVDEMLDKILKNEITLGTEQTQDTILCNTTDYEPIFNLNDEKNWVVGEKK
ncbi:MAG: phage protein Gp36 family protein [Candidatus Aenigmatarchaeota archaeon]